MRVSARRADTYTRSHGVRPSARLPSTNTCSHAQKPPRSRSARSVPCVSPARSYCSRTTTTSTGRSTGTSIDADTSAPSAAARVREALAPRTPQARRPGHAGHERVHLAHHPDARRSGWAQAPALRDVAQIALSPLSSPRRPGSSLCWMVSDEAASQRDHPRHERPQAGARLLRSARMAQQGRPSRRRRLLSDRRQRAVAVGSRAPGAGQRRRARQRLRRHHARAQRRLAGRGRRRSSSRQRTRARRSRARRRRHSGAVTRGCFVDPDGHPWEVAHNPHWALDDDGDVTLPP